MIKHFKPAFPRASWSNIKHDYLYSRRKDEGQLRVRANLHVFFFFLFFDFEIEFSNVTCKFFFFFAMVEFFVWKNK